MNVQVEGPGDGAHRSGTSGGAQGGTETPAPRLDTPARPVAPTSSWTDAFCSYARPTWPCPWRWIPLPLLSRLLASGSGGLFSGCLGTRFQKFLGLS